jgi:predicted nucleotidyltransferase
MRDLPGILDDLRHLRPDLERRYPLRGIGVFGSYVRGTQREDSDLDVLVDLGDGIGLMGFVGLQQDLSDALGLKVDLVDRGALKPAIGKRILSEAVMI